MYDQHQVKRCGEKRQLGRSVQLEEAHTIARGESFSCYNQAREIQIGSDNVESGIYQKLGVATESTWKIKRKVADLVDSRDARTNKWRCVARLVRHCPGVSSARGANSRPV